MGRQQARVLAGPVIVTVGAIIAIAASFGSWLRSGRVTRTSYDILGLIDRLGFAPDGPIRIVVRAWPLMPLLLVAAAVTAWAGWRWLATPLGIAGGVYVGGLGIAIASAVPEQHQISVGAAPVVGAVGGAVVILGSLVVAFVRVPSAHADPS